MMEGELGNAAGFGFRGEMGFVVRWGMELCGMDAGGFVGWMRCGAAEVRVKKKLTSTAPISTPPSIPSVDGPVSG